MTAKTKVKFKIQQFGTFGTEEDKKATLEVQKIKVLQNLTVYGNKVKIKTKGADWNVSEGLTLLKAKETGNGVDISIPALGTSSAKEISLDYSDSYNLYCALHILLNREGDILITEKKSKETDKTVEDTSEGF